MENASLVVVYGVPVGQTRPQRLGTGTLPLTRLVLVDPPLADQLASDRPPWVLRVGIAAVDDDAPRVEVIEVLQVMESIAQQGETMWALELTEPSTLPVSFGAQPPPAPAAPSHVVLSNVGALADLLRRLRPPLRPRIPALPGTLPHPTPPTPPPPPPAIVPAGLWCILFPRATFCR